MLHCYNSVLAGDMRPITEIPGPYLSILNQAEVGGVLISTHPDCLPQPVIAHPRIDLGGRDRPMAKSPLHEVLVAIPFGLSL
jgi:hypothetical protein